jgi:hypothetical protein
VRGDGLRRPRCGSSAWADLGRRFRARRAPGARRERPVAGDASRDSAASGFRRRRSCDETPYCSRDAKLTRRISVRDNVEAACELSRRLSREPSAVVPRLSRVVPRARSMGNDAVSCCPGALRSGELVTRLAPRALRGPQAWRRASRCLPPPACADPFRRPSSLRPRVSQTRPSFPCRPSDVPPETSRRCRAPLRPKRRSRQLRVSTRPSSLAEPAQSPNRLLVLGHPVTTMKRPSQSEYLGPGRRVHVVQGRAREALQDAWMENGAPIRMRLDNLHVHRAGVEILLLGRTRQCRYRPAACRNRPLNAASATEISESGVLRSANWCGQPYANNSAFAVYDQGNLVDPQQTLTIPVCRAPESLQIESFIDQSFYAPPTLSIRSKRSRGSKSIV